MKHSKLLATILVMLGCVSCGGKAASDSDSVAEPNSDQQKSLNYEQLNTLIEEQQTLWQESAPSSYFFVYSTLSPDCPNVAPSAPKIFRVIGDQVEAYIPDLNFYIERHGLPTIDRIFADLLELLADKPLMVAKSVGEQERLPVFDNHYGYPLQYYVDQSEADCDAKQVNVSKFQPTRMDLYIDHFQSECQMLDNRLCLRARRSESAAWENFYDDIAGFDYEWGYRYQLSVEVSLNENPAEDEGLYSYRLKETIIKTQVESNLLFDLSVSDSGSGLQLVKPGLYRLYDGKEFACSESCDTLQGLIDAEFSVLIEFQHAENPVQPLQLSQIKCSDARDSFNESCL